MTATIDYANGEMKLIDAAGNVLHSVSYWPNSPKSVEKAEAALLAWAKARNITVR